MITDDAELRVTLARIAWFQDQVLRLRATETNPANYHAASGGFLAEVDRMQRQVREYLSLHPAELPAPRNRHPSMPAQSFGLSQ